MPGPSNVMLDNLINTINGFRFDLEETRRDMKANTTSNTINQIIFLIQSGICTETEKAKLTKVVQDYLTPETIEKLVVESKRK